MPWWLHRSVGASSKFEGARVEEQAHPHPVWNAPSGRGGVLRLMQSQSIPIYLGEEQDMTRRQSRDELQLSSSDVDRTQVQPHSVVPVKLIRAVGDRELPTSPSSPEVFLEDRADVFGCGYGFHMGCDGVGGPSPLRDPSAGESAQALGEP